MQRNSNIESDITVRPAQPEDMDFLFEVYASTRSDELARTDWSDEQKQHFLAMQFTAQRRDYSQRFPGAEQSIILDNGTPAGSLWV
ncbi:GNAT family N-acetyltransferase, partial [Chloroflexota bacterium]